MALGSSTKVRWTVPWTACLAALLLPGASSSQADDDHRSQPPRAPWPVSRFLETHCQNCHGRDDPAAGLDLASATTKVSRENVVCWEQVVRKLRARQMPPPSEARPSESAYVDVLRDLESRLDRFAAADPRPGRTATFRRLTRTEYQNAIRDLLGLEVDVRMLLPADEASHGFDNVTVGELSPTLLNRYVTAARKISRLAVGGVQHSPSGKTIRIRPDVTQEEHVAGLPLGTRGGALVPYTFPRDGEYEIRIRLARDRNEHVEGLHEPHEMELLLDRRAIQRFTIQPPRRKAAEAGYGGQTSHADVDRHLLARVKVTAGRHEVGATFLKNPSSLLETRRQPLNVHFNMYRHPRLGPAVFQVSIVGPFNATGAGDTPSRQRVFVCQPTTVAEEQQCAERIVTSLLRRACRQPVTADDIAQPLAVYRESRKEGSFEDAIEMALSAVLVNPRFLFRIERDPAGVAPGVAYRVSDVELASRLSFFLWSSIPDEELLSLAEQGKLRQPAILEQQTRRMLLDKRSGSLVRNFAGQWLYLRNLDAITPDARRFPDFDDNLRQAFREETERFVESVLREDRSVLDLLKADYTYLNERLARHYGIPHVYGSRFRRVNLEPGSRRGGLLRQGSILTVTSYATRTSLVVRGAWILENLLGTPPPPPPANVPALADNTVAANLSVRQRLAQHRADPNCAGCHDVVDPIGFALENFDAVGRWRERDESGLIDARGGLPDGRQIKGVAGLEEGLLDRPELFVGTMSEKLLTYALGRGLEPTDGPAIRAVVRAAQADDFRLSSLILAIVKSTPFQMRTAQ